jgi:hypothetical protein
MGLKDLFGRWSKSRDDAALDRAERESHMSEPERDLDREDYEARKDDVYIGERDFAGAEAREAADDELA